MFNLSRGEKGFTLIEIMVVLVILGVLATISVPAFTKYVRKAKISEAISNVGSYGTAIRIYKMEKGDWPQAKPKPVPPATSAQCPDLPDIDVNEKYFTLDWTPVNKDTKLTININNTASFDHTCTFSYEIDAKTLKGKWIDGTEKCLEEYVPYLL